MTDIVCIWFPGLAFAILNTWTAAAASLSLVLVCFPILSPRMDNPTPDCQLKPGPDHPFFQPSGGPTAALYVSVCLSTGTGLQCHLASDGAGIPYAPGKETFSHQLMLYLSASGHVGFRFPDLLYGCKFG